MINRETLTLVTAVVTTYNRPKMAKRAINSVLAQTYQSLEIVVVEDGSENGVAAWMDELNRAAQIRYIRHHNNRGLAAARNTGLEVANGVYIAYLDDDDEWLPEKINRQVAYLEGLSQKPEVVFCGARVVSADGKFLNKLRPRMRGDIRSVIERKGLHTIPSSCMFQRGALMEIGGHDEDMFSHIDHDIWLKMARENYTAAYVNESLVMMHHHRSDRMTSDDNVRMKATDLFCQKWYPQLVDWFGEKNAHRYCSKFYARVLGMLGWANLERGRRWKSMRQFSAAIRHHPKNSRHYRGVLASLIGYTIYAWLAAWERRL